jgi:hypothetical protein
VLPPAGVCPLPEAVTAVLEAVGVADSDAGAAAALRRLEAWAPRLTSLGWRQRECDAAALVRAYGRAGQPQVAEALAWFAVDTLAGVGAPFGA